MPELNLLAYKVKSILTLGLPARNKTGNIDRSLGKEIQSLELVDGDPF